MRSRRYTIVLADRRSGVVRRFTIGLWPTLATVTGVMALPVLIGAGAAWKAKYDVADLYATAAALGVENANYHIATEALSGQVQGLQAAIGELGARAALDPTLQSAMDKLPAVVKNRAMGGGARRRRPPSAHCPPCSRRRTPSACCAICSRASKAG